MGTMREDFEAAVESTGAELNETEQEIITENVQDTLQEEDQSETGEQDNATPEKDVQPEAEAESSGSKDPEQKPDNEEKLADDKNKDSMKAPVDWSPSEREQWSKIPRNLQEKITAREKDMATQMAGTAQARQTHDYIAQLGRSYATVLAAEGAQSPLHAIKDLFDTVASLRMGTPQDKAVKMGELIKHYGIDIGALDSVLSGQAPENNPNAQLEQMIDKRMAPVTEMMNQQRQYQQQQVQQQQDTANRDIEKFSGTNEFLGDVRHDMADLLDMAAKHGRPLSLQQAYDRACTFNPEITKIMDQRKKTESIMGNTESMGQKHNAASSLNGRQIGTPSAGSMSMREAIADAWDNV